MDYERGLRELKQLLHDPNLVQEFQIYEARLRENLRSERLFGTNNQNQAERAQVVYQLNRLVAEARLGTSFNDLCLFGNSSNSPIPPKPNSGPDTRAQGQSSSIKSSSQRTQAYISFKEGRDASYLEELHTSLDQFALQGLNYWDRSKTLPGATWREEIDTALKVTKVAILLVSPDFLAAAANPKDPVASLELQTLLPAAQRKEIVLLNVIVRPCAFEYSNLEPFRSVNSRPLSSMSPDERGETWQKVAIRALDLLR